MTHITIKKENLALAIDALLDIIEGSRLDSVGNRNDDGLIDHDGHHDFKKRIKVAYAAITAIKEALAQPAPPVSALMPLNQKQLANARAIESAAGINQSPQTREPLYRCKNCQGIYLEKVTSCDCMPDKQEWFEGVAVFEQAKD